MKSQQQYMEQSKQTGISDHKLSLELYFNIITHYMIGLNKLL